MSTNFYDILWVAKDASQEDIKKAYRKKAMELHPDRHAWDKQKEAEFKKVNEAYWVLWDEQKRSNYDRFWSAEWMWGFGQWWFSWWVDFDISDIFESFFWWWFNSGWNRRKKDESWEDLEMNMKLSFEEAIFWTKKEIKYDKKVICDVCSWSWAKPWSKITQCQTCHWTWQIRKRTQSFFWTIEQAAVCPTCNWSWNIIETPCEKCNWHKKIIEKVVKEIEIPAWIDDWMSIKLRWEWNEGLNSRHWDLYITFKVPSSFEWLKRDWDNLHFNLDIDPIEAILWSKSKRKIPILWERIIEIKPWTQHLEILKFKWDWVKNISKDMKWDLLLHININIPTSLSKKERELYELIAKEKWIEHADHKWFFWKIFG